jgi:hypothetical protein
MLWEDSDGMEYSPLIISVFDEYIKQVKLYERNDSNVINSETKDDFSTITYDEITPLGKIGNLIEIYINEENPVSRLKNNNSDEESNDQSESEILGQEGDIELNNNKIELDENPTFISVNPLVEAGVKPTDMYGNAAKDIQMAFESTQFIGFGTIMKAGNASSTDKYAKAWGDKANTGVYTANDTIMVSGSGNFGRGSVDKTEEANAIKKTLTEKYKPLLEKATDSGASFRIGNQYAKGNLSDQLVADYLQKKGYTEEKLNGYSRWVSPIKSTQSSTNVKPSRLTISQEGSDGFGYVLGLFDNNQERIGQIVFRSKTYLKEKGYPIVNELHLGFEENYQGKGYFQDALIELLNYDKLHNSTQQSI